MLIVAAAFAAGVRREIHDLGLLAAVGGTPAQLRASVLARGVTLGLVGGLAGVALGILAAVAVYPALDRITGRLPHPLALPALPLVGAAVAAVLAGTAAALFPARFAARVPPVDALHARVPTGPPPRHVSRLGVVAIALGSAITAVGARPINNLAVSLAGLAILFGGFVACSTAVVAAVEPLARRRLPLAGRVAARQAARTRSRTGPAVAAITVALAVPVFVASVALTGQADDRAHWLPAQGQDQLRISYAARSEGEPPPSAVRAVVAAIPGAVAAPLRQALFADEQMPVVVSPARASARRRSRAACTSPSAPNVPRQTWPPARWSASDAPQPTTAASRSTAKTSATTPATPPRSSTLTQGPCPPPRSTTARRSASTTSSAHPRRDAKGSPPTLRAPSCARPTPSPVTSSRPHGQPSRRIPS
jgi:hypothetical protein